MRLEWLRISGRAEENLALKVFLWCVYPTILDLWLCVPHNTPRSSFFKWRVCITVHGYAHVCEPQKLVARKV